MFLQRLENLSHRVSGYFQGIRNSPLAIALNAKLQNLLFFGHKYVPFRKYYGITAIKL
jgi:hypothetical protein